MNKFRLYTFAICAIVCIVMWLLAVGSALMSIGDLGIIAFIVLVGIITLMLGFPLLFLAKVLGISQVANK